MTDPRNTWPGGHPHAMTQSEHFAWNAMNYPGTRQLCSVCDEPTGHTEEDSHWNSDGKPLCDECAKLAEPKDERKEST